MNHFCLIGHFDTWLTSDLSTKCRCKEGLNFLIVWDIFINCAMDMHFWITHLYQVYKSLVHVVSPLQIFVHIWLELDLNDWLSTRCIATVQIWFAFPMFCFTELALVSIAGTLSWYVYTENNSSNTFCYTDVVLQHDNMLPLRWIILRLMRQQQRCRKLEYVALFCALKLKEVCRPAIYRFFPLALHFAIAQPCFCKHVQHVFYKQQWCP